MSIHLSERQWEQETGYLDQFAKVWDFKNSCLFKSLWMRLDCSKQNKITLVEWHW